MRLAALDLVPEAADAFHLLFLCNRRMVVAFDDILGLDLNQVAIVARSQHISLEAVLPYLQVAEEEYLAVVKRKREMARKKQ